MHLSDHSVRPDGKGRITLGSLAKGISSFRVTQDEAGRIILDPYTEIPAREAWLYANKSAMKKLQTGIQQSAAGETINESDAWAELRSFLQPRIDAAKRGEAVLVEPQQLLAELRASDA